jgi:hypothetical protein
MKRKLTSDDELFIKAHEDRVETVNFLFATIVKNKNKYDRLKKRQIAEQENVICEGGIHHAKNFID